MTATDPQPTESKAKPRWFRYTRQRVVLLSLLFVVSGSLFALWRFGLPLSWTADYDRDRYNQIRRAIDADPKHLLGKSFAEVSKEFNLEDVPGDDVTINQPFNGQFRIYHFRGFAFYVSLELDRPEIRRIAGNNGLPLRTRKFTVSECPGSQIFTPSSESTALATRRNG